MLVFYTQSFIMYVSSNLPRKPVGAGFLPLTAIASYPSILVPCPFNNRTMCLYLTYKKKYIICLHPVSWHRALKTLGIS